MTQLTRVTIAQRIRLLLEHELGVSIDLQRMRDDELYARDVLLVCDAHRNTELAALARRFRRVPAQDVPAPGSSGSPGTGGENRSGFGVSRPIPPSGFDLPASKSRSKSRVRSWFSPSRWLGR